LGSRAGQNYSGSVFSLGGPNFIIGSANFGDLRRQVGTVSHCTLDQLIDRKSEGFR